MRRPVIGLCAAVERARWSAWDQEAVLLPRGYADAVQRAGGIAVMLPPDPDLSDPSAYLAFVDADDALLDSYQTERRTLAERVIAEATRTAATAAWR